MRNGRNLGLKPRREGKRSLGKPEHELEDNIKMVLLLRIRDLPASNLGQRPSILTEVFGDFPQSFLAKTVVHLTV